MQDAQNDMQARIKYLADDYSERLPTKKTEVIYSLENRYVCTGYMTDRDYNGDEMELHWEDMESGALIYPEAWMPLPEPYKGGQDD